MCSVGNVNEAAAMIVSLQHSIAEAIGPLLPAGARCALLEFPDYANVGDSAIWLGTRAWLRQARARVVYTCAMPTYDRDDMAARLGDGIVLLQGGGNLGDLWPRHQPFRERVIADFPDNRIIQLPQTICFRERAALFRARAAFDAHPNLTLLVRDERSLEIARGEFKATSEICPDMAFALGPLRRSGQPTLGILWLARGDRESIARSEFPSSPDVTRTDWLEESPTPSPRTARFCLKTLERTPRTFEAGWRLRLRAHDALAADRLQRGRRILSGCSVVVTDRLHGHILCLLLNIPHVILDTRFGKIRAFYDTWTAGCALTHWAESSEEAIAKARTLASVQAGAGAPTSRVEGG